METMKPYETEHLSQVLIVENGFTDPTDQDIECKAQEEPRLWLKGKMTPIRMMKRNL